MGFRCWHGGSLFLDPKFPAVMLSIVSSILVGSFIRPPNSHNTASPSRPKYIPTRTSLDLSFCVYTVYICIQCKCIYIYTGIYIYMCICVYIYIYIYTCVYMYVFTYIHTSFRVPSVIAPDSNCSNAVSGPARRLHAGAGSE